MSLFCSSNLQISSVNKTKLQLEYHINAFLTNILILYPLKKTEKVWFSDGSEAVTRRCSVEKVFLKISQNSQENTCARVSF